MNEMAEHVRTALKRSFAETISNGAEKPFAETGVAMPSDEVWNRYALAAIRQVRLDVMAHVLRYNDLAKLGAFIDAAAEDS